MAGNSKSRWRGNAQKGSAEFAKDQTKVGKFCTTILEEFKNRLQKIDPEQKQQLHQEFMGARTAEIQNLLQKTGVQHYQAMAAANCLQAGIFKLDADHHEIKKLLAEVLNRLPNPESSKAIASNISSSCPPAIVPGDFPVSKAKKPVKVFISYRHQQPDRELAQTVSKALQQAGHTVFIDTEIRMGMKWIEHIDTALNTADFLLLLLSPKAAESEMVIEEVMIARNLAERHGGVPIILPVRVCYPSGHRLPYHLSAYLRSIQYTEWFSLEDTPALITNILEAVSSDGRWPQGNPEPEGKGRVSGLSPRYDPRDFNNPGGALDVNDPLYIIRDVDERVLHAIHRHRCMVTLRGPRQTGKTSLLLRTCASINSENQKIRAVFIDFQGFPSNSFQTLNTLWQTIVGKIAHRLFLAEWDEDEWQCKYAYDRNLNDFLERHVFASENNPLLICLDEVERIFKSPINNDFFSSVRAFYNLGAFDDTWKQMRWLLASSSEPSFFIADLTQSPFNIGLPEVLSSFTVNEIDTFSRRLGLSLSKQEVNRIHDYVDGRPYLVHLLLNTYSKHPNTVNSLFDAQRAGHGLFREHLHRFLFVFQGEPALAAAMRTVVRGQGCKDAYTASRLESAGLTRRDDQGKAIPSCTLYAAFFKAQL